MVNVFFDRRDLNPGARVARSGRGHLSVTWNRDPMEFVDLDAAVEYGEFGLESGVAPEGYPNLMHVNVRIHDEDEAATAPAPWRGRPPSSVVSRQPHPREIILVSFVLYALLELDRLRSSGALEAMGCPLGEAPYALPHEQWLQTLPRPVPVLPSAFYVAAAAAEGVEARARAATKLAIAATAAAAVGNSSSGGGGGGGVASLSGPLTGKHPGGEGHGRTVRLLTPIPNPSMKLIHPNSTLASLAHQWQVATALGRKMEWSEVDWSEQRGGILDGAASWMDPRRPEFTEALRQQREQQGREAENSGRQYPGASSSRTEQHLAILPCAACARFLRQRTPDEQPQQQQQAESSTNTRKMRACSRCKHTVYCSVQCKDGRSNLRTALSLSYLHLQSRRPISLRSLQQARRRTGRAAGTNSAARRSPRSTPTSSRSSSARPRPLSRRRGGASWCRSASERSWSRAATSTRTR